MRKFLTLVGAIFAVGMFGLVAPSGANAAVATPAVAAKTGVSGSVQPKLYTPVHSRPYRHCHRRPARQVCRFTRSRRCISYRRGRCVAWRVVPRRICRFVRSRTVCHRR